MRLFERIPLKVGVTLLLVGPVLIVAVVLTINGYVHGRASANALAGDLMAQSHDQIHGFVDELLAAPVRAVELNVRLIDQGKLRGDEPSQWRDTLIAQAAAFERLSAITWGDERRRATWIARYAGDDEHVYYAIKDQPDAEMVEYRVHRDGTVESTPANQYKFDPLVRPWYAAPRDAGAATWCEPYTWVGGDDTGAVTLGISYGQPVRGANGGALIGVAAADLSLQDLSRFLEQLRIGDNGSAFVMDETGMLIASSTGAAVADAKGNRIAAGDADQAPIAAAANFLRDADDVDGIPFHRAVIQELRIGDADVFVRASHLTHPGGLRWTIVTLVPHADVMAEVDAGQRRSLIFAAVAIALTIALGLFVAILMVRPILRLGEHVRRIGDGDLEQTIALREAPELVQLSEQINAMTAGLRDRLRLKKSLAMAMEVQQSLLPSDTPTVDGLDIAGHSLYCDETGGDYYDFIEIAGVSEKSAAIVVGDVMGHGIAAAMLMATARGILRSHCRETGSLAELMTHLNELLVDVTQGTRFMTMLLMMVDAESRSMRFASAGHDPPFIYDPAADEFRELDGGGLPLGIAVVEPYDEYNVTVLKPGTVFVVATDGMWEEQNEAEEQYGKDRLRDSIRAHAAKSAEQISKGLRADLRAFCGESHQADDITLVVVKLR